MIYQEELFDDIVEEVKPILVEHWKELANHKDERPLDPDYEGYSYLNEMDIVRIFTARDEGKLVGYASFVISNNLHYKTWKYANNDVYYLDPSYRKTGTALIMFEEMESWLKSIGVKSITIQDKVNHSHTKFFTTLGYGLIEQVYEKVI